MVTDLPFIIKNNTNIDVNIKGSSLIDVMKQMIIDYASQFPTIPIPDVAFKSGNILFELNDIKFSEMII